jgi:hypothetical protein
MEVLKLGSKGENVKILQDYLDIKVDGEFGPNTEKAVKEFQRKKALVFDGIVGKDTWAAMGYKRTIDAWAKDKRGPVATEFVLGGQNIKTVDKSNDGVLVQAFPAGFYGWHLGTGSKKLHTGSVGIEICNFGQLVDGKTYVGTVAHQTQIVKLPKPFRGYQYWHKYSDTQISVLKNWILFIADRDDIDVRKGLIELIHKKGADAFDHFDLSLVEKTRGLWTHTNVRKDKVDLFPQPELIDMLLSI